MKIDFYTDKYEHEYGKAPKGRGWWFFSFEGYTFNFTGLYGEAKKACRNYIKNVAPAGYADTVIVIVEP